MFFTSEDDEQDFLSPGGSKLASVFGMDKATSHGGNESLTYTAPKQPKKKEVSSESSGSTAVSSATVVHAYKFVDNQYVSQGKVGAAVLANHTSNDYRILLYISKQQQLTNAKITQGFNFSIQVNNYASFYDDARVNWSVMFNNVQEAERFAKEVGLSKALAAGSHLDTVVQQDLQLGEGSGLEIGDSVEVRYTGWLLSNHTFGQVFDSNANSDKLFRFRVGKGKVIKGWDIGMLGMRKGGKRLLVIPSSMAYGAQGMGDRVPANSALIFEVEVIRLKSQKGDATSASQNQSVGPVAAPVSVPVDIPEMDHAEDTVKERSRSITEQLIQSPKSDKAKLISRMAKMGQPMLPQMSGAIPAQPDSEEEAMSPQPMNVKPQLPSKPRLHIQQPQIHHEQAHIAQPVSQQYVQQMPAQQMGQSYVQQMPLPVNTATMMGMQAQTIPVSQPSFLQNLPGSQQISLYQPQSTLLQQQQQALLAMQQQQQMAGYQIPSNQTPGFMSQPISAMNAVGPVPSSSSADPMAPILLTETRQQTTEVRLTVSKMSDKVDRILEKVENLSSGMMQHQPLPAPNMETGILLHNISRIIQENERLKKDVYEKGEKIEIQNEKIAELLQKNQKYVEKSNTLLEERNEGYKLTSDQSYVRIQTLEQEKVQIATELSTASSRIASLQLELGDLRKTEGELRQRLQSTISSTTDQREELDRLRLQRAEDEKKLAELANSLREEKVARKQADGQLTSLQEELADLKNACSSLERNLNDRKKKAAEERRKIEEDAEEIKTNYEQEIQSLREKLRKQRTNTDVETSDKMKKIEEEMAAEWQIKCDKLLSNAAHTHARQLATVQEDLQEALDKAAKMEAKILEMRSVNNSSDTKLMELQQKVEENSVFKEKYENLRNQASTMKNRYEEHIKELEDSVKSSEIRVLDLQVELQQSKQQRQQLIDQLQQQQQRFQQQLQQQQQKLQEQQQKLQEQQQQQLQLQHAAAPVVNSAGSGDTATEVKKIMNSVYQKLRGEFDNEESYSGGEVMQVVLTVIKETTLKLVQQQAQPITDKSQKDEEEEEEGEEEEDGEEEEEEDEEEEERKETAEPIVEEKQMKENISRTEITQVGSPSRQHTNLHVTSSDTSQSSFYSTATQFSSKAVEEKEKELDERADLKDHEKEEVEEPEQINDNVTLSNQQTSLEQEPSPLEPEQVVDSSLLSTGQTSIEPEPSPLEPEQVIDDILLHTGQASPEPVPFLQETKELELSVKEETTTNYVQEEVSESSHLPTDAADHKPFGSERDLSPSPLPADTLQSETAPADNIIPDESENSRERTESGSLLPSLVSREPPPLFDDDDDDDSPLFGNDDTVADTFGTFFHPKDKEEEIDDDKTKKPVSGTKLPSKNDLIDEDMKPQPPPPLFGDDDDDDDLNWLS